jgi:hypothetical protein
MDTPFSQANISPTLGTELLLALGLNALDIQNPDILRRFTEIASYLGRFDDGLHIVRMVCANVTPKDRLDKVWGYVQLRQEMDLLKSEIEVIAPELEEERMSLQHLYDEQSKEAKLYE